MADQDLSRPAFRYSSSGRRPERLNQSRDVNAPLQLLRGWAAGTLGLPGDIEGLVRMLPGIKNETPVLPTSDFYREYLPGYDPRPAARALSGLGALTGGMGATRVAREGLGALKRATDLNAIRDYVRATQGMTGLPGTAVVKPKGGNWLAGADSPEEAVRVLKTREPTATPMNEAEMAAYRAQGYTRYSPETGVLSRPDPLNQWIDQKLAKYIRNEMATPEDPLRALIQERGVSHLPLEQLQEGAEWLPDSVVLARRAGGFPEEGMALERHAAAGYPGGLAEERTRMASGWENLTDPVFGTRRAGDLLNPRLLNEGIRDMYLRENPWLAKVPPETPVYDVPAQAYRLNYGLGFDHLVDELRNAVTPNSGLPRELQLKPEQLSKVTMPQAVELVDRINKWRAAQKAEADLARSTNIATFEHKAYPEQGYRWVELRLPEESTSLPEGYSLSTVTNERLPPGHMGRNSYAVVDPQGRMLEGTGTAYTEADAMGKFKRAYYGKALEDALKYEGEVMGHCVGGYCPDVTEGRTRIFSLRDAKGQPHVTVEVRPSREPTITYSEARARAAEEGVAKNDDELMARTDEIIRSTLGPPEIVQIKGKANRAPKEEYLPFVQDFVRSGRWGRVGDLGNTGLTKVGAEYLTAEELRPLVERASQFIEQTPALERHRQAQRAYEAFRGAVPSAEYTALQRAAGEAVHPDIPYTYRELRSILDDPGAYDDPGGNLNRIEKLREMLAEQGGGFARGGMVSAGPAQYDPARIDALVDEILASAA